jgi:hypothetical protein
MVTIHRRRVAARFPCRAGLSALVGLAIYRLQGHLSVTVPSNRWTSTETA